MTRLDILIEELSHFSKEPIKKLYEMVKDIYLVNNKDIDYETDIVFNEILYFFLTDLEYGNEAYLQKIDLSDDVELLKDMIAFDCSKNSSMELSKRIQKTKMDIDISNYNSVLKSKVYTYIYSGMSLLDNRYIKNLVVHLINTEKVEIDFLVNLINKRVEGRRKVILKV